MIFRKKELTKVRIGQLIDTDGTWAYQVPMNLDYRVTDEYGDLVPSVLLTKKVRVIADMIMENVLKLEGTVTDFRKGTKERTRSENYLDGLKKNVANLPYTSNGLITDTLMAKCKRIMVEIEKEKESKTKPKTRKTRKPKVDTLNVLLTQQKTQFLNILRMLGRLT